MHRDENAALGVPGDEPPGRRGRRAEQAPAEEARGRRRRASAALWKACEALLCPSDPRAVTRALDALRQAFECDGAALHVVGATGALEPWSARGTWRLEPGDLRDCMSVPLARAGERVGSLDLWARPGRGWEPGQLALIRTAAGALGAALGARLDLQRLRHLPGRDTVTGLPDARSFRTRLDDETQRALRHGVSLAMVAVDLDHFGALNGRYGRSVGDEVLAEVALVLRLGLRGSDVLARLGGDQFGVLLPEADLRAAHRCAERLRRHLEDHRFARVTRVSASFGVAASPQSGVDALELMDGADRALTVAKKSGRRSVAVAEPGAAH